MTRLPIPGADDGAWGDILNDYLTQAHQTNGLLKAASVDSTKLAGGTGTNGQVLIKDSTQAGGMKWADAAAGTSADGAPIYLTWTGSDYAPTSLKASTTRGKIFVGPTDPATITGVVLGTYDTWNHTTS